MDISKLKEAMFHSKKSEGARNPVLLADLRNLKGKREGECYGIRNTSWDEGSLIPRLPNDVAQVCLAKVPRAELSKLRCVCSQWKCLIQNRVFYDLRLKMGCAESWLYVMTEKPSHSPFKAFSRRNNKWYKLPPVPRLSTTSIWQGFACVAVGSTILLLGGMHQSSNEASQDCSSAPTGVVSGDVHIYNACTNQWSKGTSMNTPRSWFAATAIEDCVYVAGGQGKDRFLDSVEVYNSKQDSWSYVSTMIHVRSSCYGLALHGKFWVIGGELIRNQVERGSAEVYDPQTGSWTLIRKMWLDAQKVPGPSTVHLGKLLFVHQSKIMVYEDGTNSWGHVGYLPGGDMYNNRSSRFGFACESLDDELCIVGGMQICRQHRHTVQALNSTEVCKLPLKGVSKYTVWQTFADMGECKANVLASAVLRL